MLNPIPPLRPVIIDANNQGWQFDDCLGIYTPVVTLGLDHTVVHTLNNDQIKALPDPFNGWIELLPTPETGKVILPTRVFFYPKFTSPYTNVNNGAGSLAVGDRQASFQFLTSLSPSNFFTFFSSGTPRITTMVTPVANSGLGSLLFEQSLLQSGMWLNCWNGVESASGNFTGGHADNKLVIFVEYRIYNYVDGTFE